MASKIQNSTRAGQAAIPAATRCPTTGRTASHSGRGIPRRLGFRPYLLLPRVCCAVFTVSDDDATRVGIRRNGAGRHFDPCPLTLHLLADQCDCRRASRPLGRKAAGRDKRCDPPHWMCVVQHSFGGAGKVGQLFQGYGSPLPLPTMIPFATATFRLTENDMASNTKDLVGG
jgi:hypothetical protein